MKFPIICLKEGDSNIYGFCQETRFKVANKQLVDAGIFDDVLIIDSNGDEFSIISVQIVGWAGWFLGYNPLRKGREVNVRFEIEKTKSYRIEEFKRLICQRVLESPNFLKREMLSLLEHANDFQTINNLFC